MWAASCSLKPGMIHCRAILFPTVSRLGGVLSRHYSSIIECFQQRELFSEMPTAALYFLYKHYSLFFFLSFWECSRKLWNSLWWNRRKSMKASPLAWWEPLRTYEKIHVHIYTCIHMALDAGATIRGKTSQGKFQSTNEILSWSFLQYGLNPAWVFSIIFRILFMGTPLFRLFIPISFSSLSFCFLVSRVCSVYPVCSIFLS